MTVTECSLTSSDVKIQTPKKRLSSEERREAIIGAARSVFAEKGFHGTTTRELAAAARVSEALLFQHFPNKEAIYEAMLTACHKTAAFRRYHQLLELKASTSTLMVMLHFLVTRVLLCDAEVITLHRIVLRSLSEDGHFARALMKSVGSTWVPKIRECIDSARNAGDLYPGTEPLKNNAWLAQHVFLMLALMHLPSTPAVDYKTNKEKLAEEAVVFCLRGLGLKEEAIKRHYNPRAFALLSVE